jgi:hypothetical protein
MESEILLEIKKKISSEKVNVNNKSPMVKRKMSYELDEFNERQNFLYRRALFGLSVYTQEEQNKMHWDKKKRVIKVHERTQILLNLWKQEIANKKVNLYLNAVFGKSAFIQPLLEDYTDSAYKNTLDFKDLGVKKKHIIQKLIIEGILPKGFYQLKPETDEWLPQFKQRRDNVHIPPEQDLL